VKGFIPPGVYLRDISEVRAGLDSFHFQKHKKAPVEPTHCLSLVASERTITVEFPSRVIRFPDVSSFSFLFAFLVSHFLVHT
jgi:hypothetical protein